MTDLEIVFHTFSLSDFFDTTTLFEFWFILPEFFLFISIFFFFIFLLICSSFYVLYFILLEILFFLFFLELFNISFFHLEHIALHSTFFIFCSKIFLIILFFIFSFLFPLVFKFNRSFNQDFLFFYLLLIFDALILISATELLLLFLCLELQTLIFIIFIGLNTFNLKSLEASLKYFFLGAFSGILFLFGIFLIFFSLGDTFFLNISLYLNQVINLNLDSNELINSLFFYNNFNLNFSKTNFIMLFGLKYLIYGFLFLFISLFFKFGIFGLHQWVPDIYEGSALIVTLLFSTISKILSFILIFNLFFLTNFYVLNILFINNLLACLILSAIIISLFHNLLQYNIKRLFAFGSIAQTGYVLLSIFSGSFEGILLTFMYFSFYIINIAGFFIFLLNFRNNITGKIFTQIQEFSKVLSSFKNLSFMYIFITFLLVFAGVPPLVSFFFKLNLILQLFYVSSQVNFVIILLFLILSSISIFYYLRLIRLSKAQHNNNYYYEISNFDSNSGLILSFIFLFDFYLLIFPEIFYSLFYYLIFTFFKENQNLDMVIFSHF